MFSNFLKSVTKSKVIEFQSFGVLLTFGNDIAFEEIKDVSVFLNKLWIDAGAHVPEWFNEPVSDKQLAYLRKLGISEFKGTRGQASNVISAIKADGSAFVEVEPFCVAGNVNVIAIGIDEYICKDKSGEYEYFQIDDNGIFINGNYLVDDCLREYLIENTVAVSVIEG